MMLKQVCLKFFFFHKCSNYHYDLILYIFNYSQEVKKIEDNCFPLISDRQ